MDMINRQDRIAKFLTPHLKDFIFDELSENYLAKNGLTETMSGVPIPIRKTQLNSISTLDIAKNMAFVMGCDPGFQYRDNYKAYILKVFDERFARGLIADGIDGAQKKDYDYACIQFRAAIIIDPDNIDAVYCYGRACKDAYELGEEEDFVARFKAESLEAFERVTLCRPDFAEAYYFLGYGYINLGLYVKAKLTWEDFIRLSNDDEKKSEIQQRLALLDEPVKIEEGYNLVLAGKSREGIEILSQYREGPYAKWWPLWYYLGAAYASMGMAEEAIENFLEVLKLSPSNIETMKELVRAYESIGEEKKAQKYEKKIAIVTENLEKDRLEAMTESPGKNPPIVGHGKNEKLS